MVTSIKQEPYVPKLPDFTHSFFEPEPLKKTEVKSQTSPPLDPIIENKEVKEKQSALLEKTEVKPQTPPPLEPIVQVKETQAAKEIQSALLEKTKEEAKPSFIPEVLSPPLQSLYQNFMDLCVFGLSYTPTPYGLVCPNHPEAQYPYPGSIPEDPNQDKSIFNQFIKRGVSKKFRQNERQYKDELRHWKAQMKNHILEVPYLQAKDNVFKAYHALIQKLPSNALQWAQDALVAHPFTMEAHAINAIAHYEMGNTELCTKEITKLSQLQPQIPLNSLAQRLLEERVQSTLRETYKEACSQVMVKLNDPDQKISFDQSYFQEAYEGALSHACKTHIESESLDFLDLATHYLVHEILSKNSTSSINPFSEDLGMSFPHLGALFDALQENLNLIGALDKWEEFEAAKLLKPGFEQKLPPTKEWINQLLEELSHPPSFGDPSFRRAFMQNGMKIQMEKKLFEIENKLQKSAP